MVTQLERQTRAVQRRLWFNRWLGGASGCVGATAVLFGTIVLVQRLYDLPLPVLWISVALGAIALLVSLVWTAATREDAALAAATLDQAAGLRERLSSGRYCVGSDDPFARACLADAERASTSLSPRQHIPLTAPRHLSFAVLSVGAAAMMFLIKPGLLSPAADLDSDQIVMERMEQTKVAVARRLDEVRKLAETNPALEDLKEELEGLDKQAGGMLRRPGDIRHEAVKKIDRLTDLVKKKRKDAKYGAMREMRKMMRGLRPPQSDQAPTHKLAKALAAGDFKTAKEEMNAIREHLATLKSDADKELVVKLGKQLDDLAKQLDKAAKNEKLVKKLRQAGIKKEDLERMLRNLRKKDLDQLKKDLEKKGWNQQQIQKLANQLEQQQKAGKLASKLAQQMGGAARAAAANNAGAAAAGLSAAANQLSQLEQLEQEMNQLDAAVAGLESARNDIDKPCSACQGTGKANGRPCSACKGGGRGGLGGMGQGRGGLAPEQQTNVGFKTERAKVHTGKGAIIGQFLVDGEQVKGEVSSDFTEVFSAAERDASDRINRDRVPRQYQKAVKTYFSTVQRLSERKPADESDSSLSEGESDSSGGKAE